MTKPNKAPAFQFYVKDWLADKNIRVMTPAERGAYIELMAHEWNESGKLTNCDDELAMLSGLGSDWHGKSGDKIKACFKKKGKKYLYHPRLEKEREKQRDWREKSSEGGKKSAKLRESLRKTGKGGLRVVQPTGQPTSNTTPTSAFTSTFTTTKELDTYIEKEFDKIYTLYPNKDSRKQSLKHFTSTVKTDGDLVDIGKALTNYKNNLKLETWKKPQSAKTWFNNWQDWLEVEKPSGSGRAKCMHSKCTSERPKNIIGGMCQDCRDREGK